MAEPSNISPDLFTNSQLIPEIELKHSIPLLCDSAFNAQNLEKAVDITGCITQTKVTENHWWKKSSGLIRFRCRKPIASMMINHNTRDDDDAITTFHVFGPINFFFIFGGSGAYDASLIPGFIENPSVRKAADVPPGNGNEPDQNPNNSDTNGYSSQGSNEPYGNSNGFGNGSDNDNGNGRGSNGNGDGGYDGINDVGFMGFIKPIRLHGFTLYLDERYTVPSPILGFAQRAFEYDSWEGIARLVESYFLQCNEGTHVDARTATDPNRCCLGCRAFYGRLEADHFYEFDWRQYRWNDVKLLMTDIFVIRLLTYLKPPGFS